MLACLEDQCISPSGTDEKFVTTAATKLKSSDCYIPSKNTKSLEFAVVHTIGKINYNADGFSMKNKDVLRPEIIEITTVKKKTTTQFENQEPIKQKQIKKDREREKERRKIKKDHTDIILVCLYVCTEMC